MEQGPNASHDLQAKHPRDAGKGAEQSDPEAPARSEGHDESPRRLLQGAGGGDVHEPNAHGEAIRQLYQRAAGQGARVRRGPGEERVGGRHEADHGQDAGSDLE